MASRLQCGAKRILAECQFFLNLRLRQRPNQSHGAGTAFDGLRPWQQRQNIARLVKPLIGRVAMGALTGQMRGNSGLPVGARFVVQI